MRYGTASHAAARSGLLVRRILPFVFALALAAGWQLTPHAAQPVAAACTTASCATLEIVFGSGAGSGYVSTFPGGMDCEWTGTARAGTCVVQYDVGSGLDVTLYMDPGVNSYACYGSSCAGLETRLVRTVRLNPGDNIDVFPVFNLGVRATVKVFVGGTGDGRVTSVPAGLNCRWLNGVKSGTCQADFYFYPAQTYSIQLHRTPDAGNFACSDGPPFCGAPGQVYGSTMTVSPDYMSGPPATFYEARPVAVSISGSGSVVSAPAGIDCPGACSVWLPPNYSDDPPRYTRLTATPADGWFIKDWSGACDGTSGATCQFSLGTDGATAGVVFARTSTPPPTSTPRITPRPTAAPRPSVLAPQTGAPASAAPTAEATTRPSIHPGVTAVPGSTEPVSSEPVSPEPAASEGPDGGPSAVAVAPSGAAGPTHAPAPIDERADPGGGNVTPLIALGILVASGLLVFGFAIGRRRGVQRTPPA